MLCFARTSSASVSCPPDLLGLLGVSPESAQLSAPERLPQDSGNLEGVGVSAGGLRVYSVVSVKPGASTQRDRGELGCTHAA